MKTINTIDELLKACRYRVLSGETRATTEVMVRCFFDELDYRQKRKVKKRSVNHYQDWLYYIAYDGRLARVPNTAKNPTGKRLLRDKTIKIDDYGILRCAKVLNNGQFVRVRPLLDELDNGERWDSDVKEEIAKYLDGGKQCTMVIDRDFETAYEPNYNDDFCLEGDLVTGCSCMSEQGEDAQEFYGGIENCYVCRFENDDGEQVGRCIMYKCGDVRHFIRIYAYRDYARCALRLLREELTENDIFGRCLSIRNLKLKTSWTPSTPTMYLDGNEYRVAFSEGSFWVVNRNDWRYDFRFDSTGNEPISDTLEEKGWAVCDCCGEWVHPDDVMYIEGYSYCCEDCAIQDGCVQCEHCGHWHRSDEDGYYLPSGEWACDEDCLDSMGYTTCTECNEVISKDEAFIADGKWFCNEECAKNYGYEKCSKCGEYKIGMYSTTRNKKLCSCCAEEAGMKLKWVKTKGANND